MEDATLLEQSAEPAPAAKDVAAATADGKPHQMPGGGGGGGGGGGKKKKKGKK